MKSLPIGFNKYYEFSPRLERKSAEKFLSDNFPALSADSDKDILIATVARIISAQYDIIARGAGSLEDLLGGAGYISRAEYIAILDNTLSVIYAKGAGAGVIPEQ